MLKQKSFELPKLSGTSFYFENFWKFRVGWNCVQVGGNRRQDGIRNAKSSINLCNELYYIRGLLFFVLHSIAVVIKSIRKLNVFTTFLLLLSSKSRHFVHLIVKSYLIEVSSSEQSRTSSQYKIRTLLLWLLITWYL